MKVKPYVTNEDRVIAATRASSCACDALKASLITTALASALAFMPLSISAVCKSPASAAGTASSSTCAR